LKKQSQFVERAGRRKRFYKKGLQHEPPLTGLKNKANRGQDALGTRGRDDRDTKQSQFQQPDLSQGGRCERKQLSGAVFAMTSAVVWGYNGVFSEISCSGDNAK
jgi:hypothetical protein